MAGNVNDRTSTFNLKAVVQETGLTPDTLRAWERRYGLPQPQRSAGGHRLYSQHDIEILKWLVARQEEGLSISKAVDLWNRLVDEGQDPLRMTEYAIPVSAVVSVASLPAESLTELREAWVHACLAFDEQSAEQVLSQAFALHPVETVCFEVLSAGLASIGEGWYQGEVTVQQEHFVSALARRRLESLIAATPAPTRPGRILVGAPPGEEHDLNLLMLALLLRRQGWDVVYLGANVPLEKLELALNTLRPQIMVASAQQLHAAATLLRVGHFLQKEGIPLTFGGRIFNLIPALRSRIPGHFLGDHLSEALQVVEQVMSSPAPLAPVESASEAYQHSLAHFREHLPSIEANVWQAMEPLAIPHAHLSQANESLARDIEAALALGDMDFLRGELAWVEGLLANHQLPANLLEHYLNTYYQAIRTHLDERGQPIAAWLAQLIGIE
jgi:DNA-binding transcriptional MerR regulator/methylmalonyl-CoA mutase cobalamin-binding subunit